jgi:hypothetical protein
MILNNQVMENFEGHGHYIFKILSPAGLRKATNIFWEDSWFSYLSLNQRIPSTRRYTLINCSKVFGHLINELKDHILYRDSHPQKVHLHFLSSDYILRSRILSCIWGYA